jgi:alpha 1,2-mannosyltransferase
MDTSYFAPSGIRSVQFSLKDGGAKLLKHNWETYISTVKDYPKNKYLGKGIVMTAGGISYFTCAWISIQRLRKLGNTLPIELWHLDGELSEEVIDMLEGIEGVVCRNFSDLGNWDLKGFMLKPLAIVGSQFEEILFLDADNVCLVDPTYLFDTMEYLKYGAIFWPDFWHTSPDNPIWSVIDSHDYLECEQESGQILINKSKCWKELFLCLYFNTNSKVYYRMLYGDKDTFKFAWKALRSPYHMIGKGVDSCGYLGDNGEFFGTTMVQHGIDGEILFLHRNFLKWDLTKLEERVWEVVKGFRSDFEERQYILDFHSRDHKFMDFNGDTDTYINQDLIDCENECISILKSLRENVFYGKYYIYDYLNQKRSNND